MGTREPRLIGLEYNPETGHITRTVRANNRWPPGRPLGSIRKDGYRQIRINGKHELAHLVAWELHYGVKPDGPLDHINNRRDDNRICNLRQSTYVLNSANSKRWAGKELPKGVRKTAAGNYEARLRGKSLGTYSSAEAAHAAYRRAADIQFGEFANYGEDVCEGDEPAGD